jgi:Ser/Thr protein kinase RdoA (MazF antagonist)
MPPSLHLLLCQFPPPWNDPAAQVEPILAGWSGGQVYRVQTSLGIGALRSWPIKTHPERIHAIHTAQLAARTAGMLVVPAPVLARNGSKTILWQDRWWELVDWRPGQPLPPREPSHRNLDQVADTLHQWYQAVRLPEVANALTHFCPSESINGVLLRQPAPSPGILRRLEILEQEENATPIDAARLPVTERELAERTAQTLDQKRPWFHRLTEHANSVFQLELCLRDVHREHLLFHNEQVSGLIDFGSIGFDTPAIDLARYLSSFETFPIDWLEQSSPSLAAIQDPALDVRSWADLITILAITGAVASCLHWRRWLITENRTFPSRPRALDRWKNRLEFVDRLENAP